MNHEPLKLDRIICGDNVATMATLPDACIDLVVTSPPYDNLRTYGGHSWDFEGVAQQLWRIIKTGGVVVWIVADATIDGSETGTSFRQALRFKEIGFRLHDTMIWEKTVLPLTHNRYEQICEYMFVLSKGKPRSFNPIREPNKEAGRVQTGTKRHDMKSLGELHGAGQLVRVDRIKGNVWKCAAGFNKTTDDACAFDHPALFPEALASDHILSWSNEGDIVLDPFAGSFTTCKMARLLGRRWIGIEINEAYCEIGRKRLSESLLPFMRPQQEATP